MAFFDYNLSHKILGRILAFDYGRKRTGIAVSDPLQIIANGLCTVSTHDIWTFISDYLLKETVSQFVVGYPKRLNNTASEAVRYINPFVKKLEKTYPNIPIQLIDERFTSKIATQTMIDGNVKKHKRQDKSTLDKISATIILQSFMEMKNNNL